MTVKLTDVTTSVHDEKARLCANCRAPLPPDQPAGNRYCPKCTAAWQRGPRPPK